MSEGRTLCIGMGAYYTGGALVALSQRSLDAAAFAAAFAAVLWLTARVTRR